MQTATVTMQTATVLSGELIPAKRPEPGSAWHKLDTLNQEAANQAPKQTAEQHIADLWKIVHGGNEHRLGAMIDSMDKRHRRCLFMAAWIDSKDVDTPFDQLTGNQRHLIFVVLRTYSELVQRLQKAGFWRLPAWNIGDYRGLNPATEDEMKLIQQAKAQRAEAKRRELEQQQAEAEQARQEFNQQEAATGQ